MLCTACPHAPRTGFYFSAREQDEKEKGWKKEEVAISQTPLVINEGSLFFRTYTLGHEITKILRRALVHEMQLAQRAEFGLQIASSATLPIRFSRPPPSTTRPSLRVEMSPELARFALPSPTDGRMCHTSVAVAPSDDPSDSTPRPRKPGLQTRGASPEDCVGLGDGRGTSATRPSRLDAPDRDTENT